MNKEPIKGWVKTLDRLPTEKKEYVVKLNNGLIRGLSFIPDHAEWYLQENVIEWLDETPIQSGEERWISVEDKKPPTGSDDDAYVLGYGCKRGDIKEDIAGHCVVTSWNRKFWEDEYGKNIESNPDYWFITHWLPLPKPPSLLSSEQNVQK